MIGTTVSHYRILEKLGGGGMGVVYKAEDTKLKRTVALKFFPPDLTRDEEAKERFIREAQAASALDHPNICTIHEVGETDDGRSFIVMACYEGETLKKKIERGPLQIEQVVDTAIQIAQGLAKAHAHDIVHRDVKPANIIVTEDGIAKIVDFGLAKLAGQTRLTKTGSTVGTVAYMSPEQARGGEIDHRTDIWSLGAVLYEMTTGQLPFKSEYQEAILYSILNESPAPVTGLRSGVPMELERIVKKAMQKDRSLRYQHAADLVADLAALREELGLGTLKEDPLKPLVRRRKRRYLYGGVAAIIALLAAVIVYFWQGSNQNGRTSALEEGKEETGAAISWSNTIAVLPFKNVSSDSAQEYFCDGMTEQIITNLGRLRRLGVTNYRSVSKYKNTEKTISEIGKELNTTHILEGSVYKSGKKIRITAHLTRTEGSRYLWGNDYVSNLEDVFAVQDSVSQAIATELLQTLSPSEASQIKTDRPKNTEAYDCFLKASYLSTRFERTAGADDYANAEKYFKAAMELDTTYAPAYSGLADLYSTYVSYFPPSKEGRKQSLALQDDLIQTALRLDPNSAVILSTAANILMGRGEEVAKQYELLKKAIEINRNRVELNLNMGYWLRDQGLVYHSFKYFDKAQTLDPLHPWNYAARGYSFWLIGESDKAMEEYRKALQIEPNDGWTRGRYIEILIFTKQLVEAEKLLGEYETLWPGRESGRILKAWFLAAKGEKQNALKTYREIANGGKESEIGLYALLDMKDEAIRLLDERQKGEMGTPAISRYLTLKHCRMYDALRDDNRFQEILARERQKYDVSLKNYGI
jgi:TolB-like protein/Tfp pilus assembly protein PilF